MTNRDLANLLKYCSPNIIYIVNGEYKLVKLKTPFQVEVLNDVGDFVKGMIVYVDAIKLISNGKIAFEVNGKYYHTYNFNIL